MTGPLLFAMPYNIEAKGFYFRSLKEYETQYKRHLYQSGSIVEEYELQVIDDTDYFCVSPEQYNLEQWLEHAEAYDGLSEDQQRAFKWLVEDLQKTPEDALEQCEDVRLYHGKASDYAYDYAEEVLGLEGVALQYFDCESYARDMGYNGELTELEHELLVTNPQDF